MFRFDVNRDKLLVIFGLSSQTVEVKVRAFKAPSQITVDLEHIIARGF